MADLQRRQRCTERPGPYRLGQKRCAREQSGGQKGKQGRKDRILCARMEHHDSFAAPLDALQVRSSRHGPIKFCGSHSKNDRMSSFANHALDIRGQSYEKLERHDAPTPHS
ncbi:hypothetical protein [Roseovarius sp. 217]|uniref:hypothetical protein n=1 Tax=Roseovarius sp. (strain 217) TaxID=314264 RepID=UPI0020C7CD3D|nr:hypothetical protein [Roseovarius sp. 217]